jgi:hypothetical protein
VHSHWFVHFTAFSDVIIAVLIVVTRNFDLGNEPVLCWFHNRVVAGAPLLVQFNPLRAATDSLPALQRLAFHKP